MCGDYSTHRYYLRVTVNELLGSIKMLKLHLLNFLYHSMPYYRISRSRVHPAIKLRL